MNRVARIVALVVGACASVLFSRPLALARPAATAPAVGDWVWISAPSAAVRARPLKRTEVRDHLSQGMRVRVRESRPAKHPAWLRVDSASTPAGWVRIEDISTARLAPPDAATPPSAVVRTDVPPESRAALPVDKRALEEAAPATAAATGARDPSQDLVTLQLVVDGLYLDPATYLPSPELRAKDAAEFAKGLQ